MQVAAFTVKDAKQGSFKRWLHIRAGQNLWTHFNAKMSDVSIAFSCQFIRVTSVNEISIAPALEGEKKNKYDIRLQLPVSGGNKEEGCVLAKHLFTT